MIAGQAADLDNTGAGCRSSEMLLYIHRNKTGALIRAAVRAGALIGEASDSQSLSLSPDMRKISDWPFRFLMISSMSSAIQRRWQERRAYERLAT